MAHHKFKKPRTSRAGCWCKFDKKLRSNGKSRLRHADRRRRGG